MKTIDVLDGDSFAVLNGSIVQFRKDPRRTNWDMSRTIDERGYTPWAMMDDAGPGWRTPKDAVLAWIRDGLGYKVVGKMEERRYSSCRIDTLHSGLWHVGMGHDGSWYVLPGAGGGK